ncbi:hypothetical protein CO2235_200094 [Cupriavidus oxalaticus]|uniref:Uncharacterized protein n=1 Tax=Cupriavidus oxalaticus TaxID=96344 RepID=A0A976BCV4_9BURK|nr:hypothetical protein CO2235_200094 [Cupriavidus oxalaticus]
MFQLALSQMVEWAQSCFATTLI